jgi:hypothetical protein
MKPHLTETASDTRSWPLRIGFPVSLRLLLAGALCVGASVLTSGCSSVGAASGAAAGVAVQAVTDEAVKRYMRSMHADQQNEIAALAGGMPVGDTKPWSVKHKLPIENGHGEVQVTRAFTSALAICKEFVFSVADGDKPDAHEDWYTASACLQDNGWRWASAEPAVERWGNLQ